MISRVFILTFIDPLIIHEVVEFGRNLNRFDSIVTNSHVFPSLNYKFVTCVSFLGCYNHAVSRSCVKGLTNQQAIR